MNVEILHANVHFEVGMHATSRSLDILTSGRLRMNGGITVYYHAVINIIDIIIVITMVKDSLAHSKLTRVRAQGLIPYFIMLDSSAHTTLIHQYTL